MSSSTRKNNFKSSKCPLAHLPTFSMFSMFSMFSNPSSTHSHLSLLNKRNALHVMKQYLEDNKKGTLTRQSNDKQSYCQVRARLSGFVNSYFTTTFRPLTM